MQKPLPNPTSDTTIRVSRRTLEFLERMETLLFHVQDMEGQLSGQLFPTQRWTHEATICWLVQGGSEAELRSRQRRATRLLAERDKKAKRRNALPPPGGGA